MKISDLLKETKKLELTYKTSSKEFPIEVVYRTQVLTPAFMKSLDESNFWDRAVEQIVHIVESWDLQREDGSIVKVTKDAIVDEQIPFFLLEAILTAISDDVRSSRESKNA